MLNIKLFFWNKISNYYFKKERHSKNTVRATIIWTHYITEKILKEDRKERIRNDKTKRTKDNNL